MGGCGEYLCNDCQDTGIYDIGPTIFSATGEFNKTGVLTRCHCNEFNGIDVLCRYSKVDVNA